MTSCIVEETVESSTFLATSKSIASVLAYLNVVSVEGGWYYSVMDNGEKKRLNATAYGQGAGLFILLSGRASHLMMSFAECRLLLRSNILTSVTYLPQQESPSLPWANSGTLTRLQSTLSKLADEA